MSTSSSTTPSGASRNHYGSIAIIGALFFIFGFVTWLNGPLISFARLAFDVSDTLAFLIPFAFYISYFCLALPSSWILKRTGMKKGMALGLFLMAVGALVFGQYTTARVYPGALTGIFVIGAGLAILQTAANPYISILGPIEGAAQRIAVMGICNKVAGILAPLVLGAVVLHGMGDLAAQVAAADASTRETLLNEFAARIHDPYMVMAGVLALLAIGIVFSPLPEIRAEEVNTEGLAGNGGKPSIFQFPHVWLGALCIFVYVGVEVMAGDAIGTYGQGFGLPLDQTKFFTSLTLGGMLLGYVLGLITIPRFISQERYLAYSAVLGVLLAVGAFFTHGFASVVFVAALGFANAMMWPAIFPLAIQGLGRFTEYGSALLIMGIAGGAVIPQLFVHLKQTHDFQLVFLLLMVPCYLYILYFALRGHNVGHAPRAVSSATRTQNTASQN
jgi:glucose/galactose transporter